MKLPPLAVLHEDNHLLVVVKPAGLLVQGDNTGDVTLLEIAKQWLIQKYKKPGNAFLGLVHRLDRPVAGVVVLAKTSKAASRLSTQFRERTVQKFYLAVVEGRVTPASGTLTHYIKKRLSNRRVQIANQPFPDGSKAELSYKMLEEIAIPGQHVTDDGHHLQGGVHLNQLEATSKVDSNSVTSLVYSLLQVQIHTGRHHQIRAQLSYLRHPIAGDRKYGARTMLPNKDLALFASQITILHPTQKTEMTFRAEPPDKWPWTLFSSLSASLCSL
jgi:23S rRNA pseudouridine1911/1915/1917 synthase